MTDKVQKIRKEVERIQLYTQSDVLKQILDYIDKVQKEPASEKKCMYAQPNYTNGDRLVLCKDCNELCKYNQKTAAESLGISQEVYDKIVDECIYGKEPEMVDVDDSPKGEPVSDGLEVAAEECIEELLPETALDAAAPFALEYVVELLHKAFKAGAEWQKKQIMKDAIDCFVGPREGWFYIGPLIPQHYYNLEKDEEIKMVIIKE
jgi:hypothetical protein